MRLLDSRYVASERLHLKRLLQHLNVDCVFDVGANAGQYAAMLRNEVGYRGRIISFEPIPYLAEHLRAQAKTDQAWDIQEIALADEDGEVEFNIMESDRFSSMSAPSHDEVSLFKTTNSIKSKIKVKKQTLQSAFEPLRQKFSFKTPFLKMDTQGFDVDVVKGAGDTIREFVGLQSELAVKRLYEHSTSYQDAITFYEQAGFELSALVPNNAGHFPVLVEIDCIMVRSDLIHY